ncbi:hypothetical protein DB32_004792 [Sandaracinus amylolyticus]|uniref:Uncharacterized protein n=1 Tax=Sandaracinus amylolyticus TaxID=927083 RepID=A0A0F6W504_9BACT|nr:hypothetical protein DB32_004792 [Sandaracinus amylolyticus]
MALVARMRELEARWTEAFWAEVAPSRGLPHPGPEPSIDRIAELAARVSALEALEARHGAVVLEWSTPGEVRRTAHSVRSTAPRAVRWLEGVLPDAYRARAESVADMLVARAAPIPIDVRTAIDDSALLVEIAAPVAPGVATLSLGPETLWHSLGKMLGSREIELGDSTFDGAFLVAGDEETVRAVLDAPTRAALLALGTNHRAELRIAPGEARVGTARLDPLHGGDEALDALVAVIRSAVRAPIRRLRAT